MSWGGEYHFGLVNMWTNINGKLASGYHFVQHLIDTSHFRDFLNIISTVEKLNSRRKDLLQYDKFVNTYMASLTEEKKKNGVGWQIWHWQRRHGK